MRLDGQLVAALLAGVAAVLWLAPSGNLLRRRLAASSSETRPTGLPQAFTPGRPTRSAEGSVFGRTLWQTGLAGRAAWPVGLTAGILSTALAGPAAGIVGGLAAMAIVRSRQRARSEQVRSARRAAVVEACLALAAELRAGQPPPVALETAAAAVPDLLLPPARRAALGGNVASDLREQARQPGAEALAAVGLGWEVSMRTGAGLADVLSRVAAALQADLATRAETESQLASAKVTARLLAVLPVLTLLMGTGLGGQPFRFLTATPAGVACLFGGVLLTWAGVRWVDRLARVAAG